MKFGTLTIAIILITSCKAPNTVHTISDSKAIKKEEQKDIDSLFLVYSLPINISHTNNFTQLDLEDTLIALLKEKKYKYLDKTEYLQFLKLKWSELIPASDPEGAIAKLQTDKDYFNKLFESAPPFAQQIQLSFFKKDDGISYLSVRRFNQPKPKQSREWTFKYSDLKASKLFANRILDSLIN